MIKHLEDVHIFHTFEPESYGRRIADKSGH